MCVYDEDKQYRYEKMMEWFEEKYQELDKYYEYEITCPKLRSVFIRALAHSWGESDEEINKEYRKCDFTWAMYYYIVGDEKNMEREFIDEVINDQPNYMYKKTA